MKNEILKLIEQEKQRQDNSINLIASENYVSDNVLNALGSVLTNKYAEGYPKKRYYGGCEIVDKCEKIAQDLAKKLFNAQHVNVQPHSGSQANMAVYFSVLKPGDTILGMSLTNGGHLTHGHPINFSGKLYKIVSYGVNKDTELLDYDEIEKLAQLHKPKLIVAGASAYSRIIDFERFGKIAKNCGAFLLADIAHIAGLIATGLHPSPIDGADFVSTTTHKTLRGPRGGMVMCKAEFANQLDKTVMPGMQGGPLMNVIAAKAIAFNEALLPEFKIYQEQVIKNAKAMAKCFKDLGYKIVSGDTDNHLFSIDLRNKGISGLEAETALGKAGIIVNRNTIPNDPAPPTITSGIRIGTPAITTRGAKEQDVVKIACEIDKILGGK